MEMLYRQLIEGPAQHQAPSSYSTAHPSHQRLNDTIGWMQRIVDADLIMIAAHSQGTPVSVMLVARLIREGLINLNKTKVCISALAGISHGPFPSLRSSIIVKYFEADAARELFAFNDW